MKRANDKKQTISSIFDSWWKIESRLSRKKPYWDMHLRAEPEYPPSNTQPLFVSVSIPHPWWTPIPLLFTLACFGEYSRQWICCARQCDSWCGHTAHFWIALLVAGLSLCLYILPRVLANIELHFAEAGKPITLLPPVSPEIARLRPRARVRLATRLLHPRFKLPESVAVDDGEANRAEPSAYANRFLWFQNKQQAGLRLNAIRAALIGRLSTDRFWVLADFSLSVLRPQILVLFALVIWPLLVLDFYTVASTDAGKSRIHAGFFVLSLIWLGRSTWRFRRQISALYSELYRDRALSHSANLPLFFWDAGVWREYPLAEYLRQPVDSVPLMENRVIPVMYGLVTVVYWAYLGILYGN